MKISLDIGKRHSWKVSEIGLGRVCFIAECRIIRHALPDIAGYPAFYCRITGYPTESAGTAGYPAQPYFSISQKFQQNFFKKSTVPTLQTFPFYINISRFSN